MTTDPFGPPLVLLSSTGSRGGFAHLVASASCCQISCTLPWSSFSIDAQSLAPYALVRTKFANPVSNGPSERSLRIRVNVVPECRTASSVSFSRLLTLEVASPSICQRLARFCWLTGPAVDSGTAAPPVLATPCIFPDSRAISASGGGAVHPESSVWISATVATLKAAPVSAYSSRETRSVSSSKRSRLRVRVWR